MIKLENVILAIKDLGGKASLCDIYKAVASKCQELPNSWKDVIRAYIYHNSTDAQGYENGNPNIFFKSGRGVWGLRHPQEIMKGRSEEAIAAVAYTMITEEEIKKCDRDEYKVRELIEKKISEVKRKYDML